MLKNGIAALALLALAFSLVFVPSPTTAQNLIGSGRYLSDSGQPVYGYATATDTTAQTMASAGGATISNYLYWASCVNTSAATVTAALIKSGSTSLTAISCPAASALSQPIKFDPPIRGTANAAITMEATASTTTVYFTTLVRRARFQ